MPKTALPRMTAWAMCAVKNAGGAADGGTNAFFAALKETRFVYCANDIASVMLKLRM